MIVGDGPLRDELRRLAQAEGVADSVWLAGARDDVPQVMAGLDASRCRRWPRASRTRCSRRWPARCRWSRRGVGGNPELVEDGVTGTLVPAARPGGARTRRCCATSPIRDGAAGMARRRAPQCEARFSLDRMVADYAALYERLAARRRGAMLAADAAHRLDTERLTDMCGITGIIDLRGKRSDRPRRAARA